MEFSFNSRKIRKICEDDTEAENIYGRLVAFNLRKRLADLQSARSIYDGLLVGNPTVIDRGKKVSLNLTKKAKIIFTANHVDNPLLESGLIDWSQVRRIKILKIEVYE